MLLFVRERFANPRTLLARPGAQLRVRLVGRCSRVSVAFFFCRRVLLQRYCCFPGAAQPAGPIVTDFSQPPSKNRLNFKLFLNRFFFDLGSRFAPKIHPKTMKNRLQNQLLKNSVFDTIFSSIFDGFGSWRNIKNVIFA